MNNSVLSYNKYSPSLQAAVMGNIYYGIYFLSFYEGEALEINFLLFAALVGDA